MTYDPQEHSEALGFRWEYYPLRTCFGLLVPEERLILLRPRMRASVERCVHTHENMHWVLGHTSAAPGVWGAKQERAADRAAARLLISHEALRDVARTTPDKGRWAVELGVTGDILNAYLASLPQIRDRAGGRTLRLAS